MFSGIGWGTYALFAALNIIIIFPVVYLYFPETKRYALEDIDLIFAVAHDEGVSPVSVSVKGNIPPAGSPEAEAILGRTTARPDMNRRSHSHMGRVLSREKNNKREVSHHENV